MEPPSPIDLGHDARRAAVVRRIRDRTGVLGTTVGSYLYAESLMALESRVGTLGAVRIMNVFCCRAPGEFFTDEEFHQLSRLPDRDEFERAKAAACQLALVRALDGNTSGEFSADSTTHTAESNDPWWEVDLGKSAAIDRVVLWNRTDSNLQSRLKDARVILLDDARRMTTRLSFAPIRGGGAICVARAF